MRAAQQAVRGTICSISGSVVTAKAKGTCSITALQAGNTVYASAVPVTVKIAVRLAVYLTASVSVGGKTMTANPLTVKKYTKVTLKVSTKPVLKTKYVDEMAETLDEALLIVQTARELKEAKSVALLGNAAEILPELLAEF